MNASTSPQFAQLQADGAPLTGAQVAKRLGRTTKQLGPHRARLIRKGTLTARGDELFFTVPGMGAYIRGLQGQHRARSHRPLDPNLGR